MLANAKYPVQIVWAGKPYPVDYPAITEFNHLVHLSAQTDGEQQQQHDKLQAQQAPPNQGKAQQARHQQAQQHAQQLPARKQGLQLHRAQRQPLQKRRVPQSLPQGAFQPFHHLAQTQGHCRREQQGQGPKHQEGQCTMRLWHKPARAKARPAVQPAPALKGAGQHCANHHTNRVEKPIQRRGHPCWQIGLQALQHQGQGRARQDTSPNRPPALPGTQGRQGQPKSQRGIAPQIGEDIKAAPVGRDGRRQKRPGRQALIAPVVKRIEAGVDNQRRVDPGQGPG